MPRSSLHALNYVTSSTARDVRHDFDKGVLMKRFMGLALILFGAGLALVLYAVLFGPREYKNSMIQNTKGRASQQQLLEQSNLDSKSGTTQPAPGSP